MRILVVDDSVVMRRICMNVIRKEFPDVDFVEAEDGLDAKGKVKTTGFDLILLDWNLPFVDGYEFLTWLRTKHRSDTPAVMVTVETTKDHVLRAVKAGANQYVVKPFSSEMLLSKVRSYLECPDPEKETDDTDDEQ